MGAAVCGEIQNTSWIPCLDANIAFPKKSCRGSFRRRAADASNEAWNEEQFAARMEQLTQQLFSLHDLNNDGMLAESELVKLNEQIYGLHHGHSASTADVRKKYQQLFREKLDPQGNPVRYEKFRIYATEVLHSLDEDPEAQEMILEQFIAEAEGGRKAISFALNEQGGTERFVSFEQEPVRLHTGRSQRSPDYKAAALAYEDTDMDSKLALSRPPRTLLATEWYFRKAQVGQFKAPRADLYPGCLWAC